MDAISNDSLSGLVLNSPLPLKPKKVDLRGKGGTSVQVDPRRVRPFPANPRSKNNPGFSSESLRELAQSIAAVGQVEDGLVCPISDDSDYDAQLIDGDRRHRACLLAELMMKVSVREDVSSGDTDKIFLLSVARNHGKAPQTALENAHVIHRLRTKNRLTIEETAKTMGMSAASVSQHSLLLKLHPDVQQMLDPLQEESGTDGEGVSASDAGLGRRRLTFQLAIMLVKFTSDEQIQHSRFMLSRSMNLLQARRYLLNCKRVGGGTGSANHSSGPRGRGTRPSERLQTLETLVDRTTEAFGIYTDMHPAEIKGFAAHAGWEKRKQLREKLKMLSGCLSDISNMMELKVAVAK